MRKFLLLLITLFLPLPLMTVWAADTAVLTVTPNRTELVSSDIDQYVTFTLNVAPPQGMELGVFSVRLSPEGGLTLPEAFQEDGKTRITVCSKDQLAYDGATGQGVFRTYEYTPSAAFFAAVGTTADNRMTAAADILTITATVPAGFSGTCRLDAEFVAAPDGSGRSYAVRVDSPDITVAAPVVGADGTVQTDPVPDTGSDTVPDLIPPDATDGSGAAAGSDAPAPDGDAPVVLTPVEKPAAGETSSAVDKVVAVVVAAAALAAAVLRLLPRWKNH